MSDPISDMLTRVRNAIQARHTKVDIPASRLKIEIARILKITPRTVAFHKYGMMKRLGVRSTAELVKAALKMGVVAG